MAIISVKNLNKTFKVSKRKSGLREAIKSFYKREYKYIEAVIDVSFSIEKGEIVGYIGPNGAGKSTTIKILSGILIPDSGEYKINRMIPWKDRKKYVSNIGVVFGQRSQLMWDIPAIDTFDLLKDIYKLDKQKYETTKNELIIRGDYDRILIRPRGIVTQVMIFQFDTFKIIRTLQSIIIMLIALINLKIKWNIYKVFVLIFSLSSSTLIFFGVFLLGASYCFFQFKA